MFKDGDIVKVVKPFGMLGIQMVNVGDVGHVFEDPKVLAGLKLYARFGEKTVAAVDLHNFCEKVGEKEAT